MAREPKSALAERLRQAGQFESFKSRREELKAQGVPARQAWSMAGGEFVPHASKQSQEVPADLRVLRDKPGIPIVEAAGWVFECLDADWITPADAPCAGAWSLLQWARTNAWTRSDFYRLFAAKIMRSSKEASQRGHKLQRFKSNSVMEDIERCLARSERVVKGI